jgi:hypothetical protein
MSRQPVSKQNISKKQAWVQQGSVACALVLAAAITGCGGADEDEKRGIGGAEAAAALGTPATRPVGAAPSAATSDSRVVACSDLGVSVGNTSALQPASSDTFVVRRCE